MVGATRSRSQPHGHIITYQESSGSDSDSSDVTLSQNNARRRSHRQHERLQGQTAYESTSTIPHALGKRSRGQPSYNEMSADEESEPDVVVQQDTERRKKPDRATKSRAKKRTKLKSDGRPSNREGMSSQVNGLPMPSANVKPPLAELPYEILLSIFQYTIPPVTNDDVDSQKSISWILRTARMCKAFVEPALTALYSSPPLHSPDKPFKLLDLLTSNQPTAVNYRTKVKRLHLDAKDTLAYSYPLRGHFQITALIGILPQLQDLFINGLRDRPPFFIQSSRGSWSYPVDLFTVMNAAGIRLKRLLLHGDMLQGVDGAGMLEGAFDQPCLQQLEHLTLSNIILDRQPGKAKKQFPSIYTNALSGLSNLKSLCLRSCLINASWGLLERLPNRLRRLAIINCPDFSSSVLRSFLAKQGEDIRELHLHHNNGLDLSFLQHLRVCCPTLEALHMDLQYYSNALLFKSSSAEPSYDALLLPGDIPSWPSSLREVEILAMRKWSQEAAVAFFQSLCDSAAELRALRYLTIKAMLDIAWRDRAGFREKWISKLHRTLLNRSEPPLPHLASLETWRMWKETQSQVSKPRVSLRQEAHMERTTRRAATRKHTSISDEELAPVQGLCEKVDIVIDNMRPSEMQFNENDFMDSELSGDDDWTGSEPGGSPQYAW